MNKKFYFIAPVVLILAIFIYFNFKSSCSKKDEATCIAKINGMSLMLNVAYSEKRQSIGLMHVTKLEENEGMIFVYDEARFMAFWMKNTLIPLSIAYVEADGRIAGIYNMYPVDKNMPDYEIPTYPAPTKVKYAIETKQGWFDLRGIKEGTYIEIPKELK